MENIKGTLTALIDGVLHLKEYSDGAETLEQLQDEIDSVFEGIMTACKKEG